MSLTSIYLKNLSQIFWYHTEKGFLTKFHPISKMVLMFVGIAIAVAISEVKVLLIAFAILVLLGITSIKVKRFASLYLSLILFVSPMMIIFTLYTFARSRSVEVLVNTSISLAIAFTRLMIMSTAFYIFLATTRPQSIARILSKLGFPYRYSYGFVLAIRFLSVIANDLIEILSVQKTRGLFLRNSLFERIRSFVAISIPLVISTLNRIDEITISLEVKGFGFNSRRSYLYSETFGFHDIVFICFCLTWFALSIIFGI